MLISISILGVDNQASIPFAEAEQMQKPREKAKDPYPTSSSILDPNAPVPCQLELTSAANPRLRQPHHKSSDPLHGSRCFVSPWTVTAPATGDPTLSSQLSTLRALPLLHYYDVPKTLIYKLGRKALC
jgi:hypothetical protein